MKKASKSKKKCKHWGSVPYWIYKPKKNWRWYWHCMDCGSNRLMKDDWQKPEDFFFINHRG